MRTARELFQGVREWNVHSDEPKERDRRSRVSGVSGESKLWRLYHLYGFDLSKDMVFDVMHIMGLNLFKNFTKLFLKT